jgi:hypothetical protein
MQNSSAETAKKTAPENELAAQHSTLDQRYRQIGISAVAAAVRYQGAAKNPAYAPVVSRWTEDMSGEAA